MHTISFPHFAFQEPSNVHDKQNAPKNTCNNKQQQETLSDADIVRIVKMSKTNEDGIWQLSVQNMKELCSRPEKL